MLPIKSDIVLILFDVAREHPAHPPTPTGPPPTHTPTHQPPHRQPDNDHEQHPWHPPNNDSPMADNELVAESLHDEIGRALSLLNTREQIVVKAFYGIGEPEQTLDEIGKKTGLSRERVRQIREKAIRKLRNNTKSKLLKGFLGQ